MTYLGKFSIFITSFVAIAVLLGNNYNCIDDCILNEAGKILAIFIFIVYLLLFFDKIRKNVLKILKLYIPAIFVFFTALFYIDSAQYEQQLKIQKEYRNLKLSYTSLNIQNISKKNLDAIVLSSLKKENTTFKEYTNKLLNGYKVIIGKSMIGLSIGLLIILFLDILNLYYKKEYV